MRFKILILGICISYILPVFISAEKTIILKQENALLKITEYKAEYRTYKREHISHSIKAINSSDKLIVAYHLSFITFDVFNEFLDKFNGFSVDKVEINKEEKAGWRHSPYAVALFEDYGTAVVYVDKIRFENGTIWAANKEEILPQIQEIQESFSAELLEEKK